MEFTISHKTGIRELTNESWNRVLNSTIDSAVSDSVDLVPAYGQEMAAKVGMAVVARMIGQTVVEAKAQAQAEFDRRFREALAKGES